MSKHFLLAPGPTPVPPEVRTASAQPIIHHRTAEYRAIFAETCELLRQVYRTAHPVLTFAASGTGAMEAAVVNTLSAGDTAIVPLYGKFSERWAEICEAYGVTVVPVEVEWGDGPTPEQIRAALQAHPDTKVVFSTLCETSTCVRADIEGIGAVVKAHGALLVCDGVSGLAAEDLRPDDAGIDILVTGSQKALMLPPGLAFLSVSPAAEAAAAQSTLPAYYFSVPKALAALKKEDTAFTPAVSLTYGLRTALHMILDEGIERVVARHARHAAATRAGVDALELPLFSKRPSNVATAVCMPDGINADTVKQQLFDEHQITVAGGQAQLKGRILRIAHLGFNTQADVCVALTGLATVLGKNGHSCSPGDAINAAETILSAS